MVYKIILLCYFIILIIGSVYDFKYREIPNYIHIIILCLCLFNLYIDFTGLILPTILLILVVFTNFNIGGGDIKFIGATGLFLGLESTILMVVLGIFVMLIYYGINKVLKSKQLKSLPFLPFFLIGNLPILLYSILI